jgi:transcriptional regulator with XRE-family HTH domain
MSGLPVSPATAGSTGPLAGRVAGAVLAVVRRSAGLTQEELADRSGVSAATLQGWEQGRKPLVNVTFTRLHGLRGELQAAGAAPGLLEMLDRALAADVMLAGLNGTAPERHPLALSVPDRTMTELMAWPLSGRPPRQLNGHPAPITVGQGELAAVTGSLLELGDRARGEGEKPFMIRRQVTFLLAQARDVPDVRGWAGAVPLSEWTPQWTLARSAAVAASQGGDLGPLHQFTGQGLEGDRLITANLNYWAYWVGEYPAAWANDSEMTGPDGEWAGVRLLGSLLAGVVSAPYRDLCAHTLWALLLQRRHLAGSPRWQPQIRAAVAQALDGGHLEQSARRRAESVEYLVRS